jgi:DNA-binding response OmpR family regulator
MSTLLLIEDSPMMATLLRMGLERAGHAVTVLHTGTPVVATARAQPPELILLDALLPDIDGFTVAQQLKADPLTCVIPLVFLTALTDETSLRLAREAGADAVLTKLADLGTIVDAVNTLLAEVRRDAHGLLAAC